MKETIFYYKNAAGRWFFSNGQVKNDDRASQYLRMLRYAGYPLEPLYLDNPSDFNKIVEIFHIPKHLSWQQVYNGQ